jgi:hypothetical protein
MLKIDLRDTVIQPITMQPPIDAAADRLRRLLPCYPADFRSRLQWVSESSAVMDSRNQACSVIKVAQVSTLSLARPTTAFARSIIGVAVQ